MDIILENISALLSLLSSLKLTDLSATASTSFLLIAAAEIGDKSQLVCMTLAARHRAAPVLIGAVTAFALLNTLAVIFGSAIADWFPDYIVSAVAALLFAIFGLHSLLMEENTEEDEEIIEKKGTSIFFTTFLLITIAEFGDKTQLAVVALSSTALPIAVWLGATCALALTSVLGVVAGRTVLQKFPLTLLHKISGTIFLFLAIYAGYTSYINFIQN